MGLKGCKGDANPYAQLNLAPIDLHLVDLDRHRKLVSALSECIRSAKGGMHEEVESPRVHTTVAQDHHIHNSNPHQGRQLTRKSTPIVAVASSSGIHCSSEKRKRRLLLPTDALPMSSSLTLTGVVGLAVAVDVSPALVLTGGMTVNELASATKS